jgi:hypothetical protein
MSENVDLIRKIAWMFHDTTGIEFEELFSEAALAYCEGLENGRHPYDPEKGNITTYMWHRITNHLRDYLKKQPSYKFSYNHEGIPLRCVDVKYMDRPISNVPFWEALNNEAQEIANIVLSSPKTYLRCSGKIEAIKKVERVLKDQGWDKEKIKYGINNLKLVFS